MIEIQVGEGDSGQRLDKLLARYMREAPKGFLYKMLRKKNITLNGKKAEGKEILQSDDVVKLFLSDETYEKFGGVRLRPAPEENSGTPGQTETVAGTAALRDGDVRNVPALVSGVQPPAIVYEDAHILLFNKPAGMLSQKAVPADVSLVEYLNAYLLASGSMTREQMRIVRPAICNRLDRNTSGLVVAGKSLAGLQSMNQLLKERTVRKFYRCIVCGEVSADSHLRGYLKKNERTNTVTVTSHPSKDAKPIETEYHVLSAANGLTLLEVHLITGRSHQIRAHLASAGYPILGDPKYGNPAINKAYARSHGIRSQLLHAYRLEFPQLEGTLSYLSGQSFCAPVPEVFQIIMGGIYGDLEYARPARFNS
ncbi:MAG: RluA family pseudouridine synthase [Lachnospiraceae bacterium]|nr:RluA family pseudouridine synthase [Lachnospiraceae bacterium]